MTSSPRIGEAMRNIRAYMANIRDAAVHTGLTPTRKSHRDSCWQFGCQALTSLGWLRNHVKVMGERKNSQLILQVYLNLNIIRWLRRYEMKMKRKNNS